MMGLLTQNCIGIVVEGTIRFQRREQRMQSFPPGTFVSKFIGFYLLNGQKGVD
jgi:hypothetical protein